MVEFKTFLKKYKFPIILLIIFIVIVFVIIYFSNDIWSGSTLSLIGSIASVLAFVIVIKQLMELVENTEELKSRTEELSETYSSAIYNLVNSETIYKISKASEVIKNLKKSFNKDTVKDSRELFDELFTMLTELDQLTTLDGFEGKINSEQLANFIGFCMEMSTRIYSDENINKENLKEEFSNLYQLESFLITINTNLRIN